MFAEIYHPVSGAVYGGIQEGTPDWQWHSCRRQTWSATAYLRMVLMGLAGMDFSAQGIHFRPMLLPEISRLELRDLPYRQQKVNIQIQGAGQRIREFRRNGQRSEPFLPSDGEPTQLIEIVME